MVRSKATLVTLAAVIFLLVAYLIAPAAHAIDGGADGGTSSDYVVGTINDDAPSLIDGVGDYSDVDTLTPVNSWMALQDASGANLLTGDLGDGVTNKDPHPPLIRVRTQYQVWSRSVLLSEPRAGHANVHIQATITTEYYFWHGWPGTGWAGNHVTPFGVDLCYAFEDGWAPSLLWGGISADATWFDDKRGIAVSDLRTGDKDRGGCIHEKVPVANRRWLKMIQHPAWLADGWINWKLDGDQSFHWHTDRIDDSKWLSPAKDPVMTTKSGKVWHNIYKTW